MATSFVVVILDLGVFFDVVLTVRTIALVCGVVVVRFVLGVIVVFGVVALARVLVLVVLK